MQNLESHMNQRRNGAVGFFFRANTALLITFAAAYITVQAEARIGLLTFDPAEFCLIGMF